MKLRLFNKKIKQKDITIVGKVKNKDRKSIIKKGSFGFIKNTNKNYYPCKEFLKIKENIAFHLMTRKSIVRVIEGAINNDKKYESINLLDFYFDLLELRFHYKKLYTFLKNNLINK